MKIGLYPMVADVLHTGHVIAIEEAKKYCDYLIVALYCKPERKKVYQSIYERYMQLRAVKWVDEVIPYENSEDGITMLRSLDYDIYFLGEDYSGRDFEGKSVLGDLQKEIHYLRRRHDISSTSVKRGVIEHTLDKMQG